MCIHCLLELYFVMNESVTFSQESANISCDASESKEKEDFSSLGVDTNSSSGSYLDSYNPHGIDSILNRRSVFHTPSNSATYPVTNTNPSQSNDITSKTGAAVGNNRSSALYWPGIQGLLTNPNLWRERAPSGIYTHQFLETFLNY